MKIKIVLFDAVGVLFPANTVVGDDLARSFNLSTDQLSMMWKGFYGDYTTGKLTTDGFLDKFAATYNLPRQEVTQEVFTAGFQKALSPMPGMEDMLTKLQTTGVTIAMLSDTAEMFADSRRSWVFGKYFDHIFLSFEIGYRKPDPHAFQVVLDYYKAQPYEVLFIDDSQANVDAAKQCGMNAILFTDAHTVTKMLEQHTILIPEENTAQ